MVLPLLTTAIGAALWLLAFATRIPLLAVVGTVYFLGTWALRARGQRGWRSRLSGLLAAVAIGVGAPVSGSIAYLWWNASPPAPDAFYTPPSAIPAQRGALLREEPFTRAVPTGARAWRILYTTSRADGQAAVASAVVLAPVDASAGPRPVVTWTHGTTGAVAGCAPSVLPAPFPFDATLPALDQIVANKWVLVAPDYTGLGTSGPFPYLIGEGEGRSVLDAVRAARHVQGLALEGRTVVWGHSQGGHAALWTGIIAPAYAADVSLAGVAALAPATDLRPLVEAAQHLSVGKLMASYVVAAYSDAYPDVRFDDYVGPSARGRALAGRCLSGPGALLSLLVARTMERPFFARPPGDGPLGVRLAQNAPRQPIAAPLLIAQGLADRLVLPSVQASFVEERCAAGQELEYRTYEQRDHVDLVAPGSPLTVDLVEWTRERFAAAPVRAGCRTVQR